MEIRYNITGNERKTLILALERLLDQPKVYNGAPSFSYDCGGFNVDREGTLTGPDDRSLVADLESLHSFKAVEEIYDAEVEPPAEPEVEAEPLAEAESRTYQAELSDPDCPDRMEVFSAEDDADALRQAREFCKGEVVLLELFELDENYDVIRGLEIPPCRLTITVPLEGFGPEAIDRVCKLVSSKETLLKMALGANALPVQVLGDQLAFPWFANTGDEATIVAYSQLITAICRTASEKTRVNAQAKEDYPNPRFTMRCWLISLGLVGDEFRLIRKLMTSTLPGNGAYSRGYDPRKAAQAEAATEAAAEENVEAAGDNYPGEETPAAGESEGTND